jgi:acetolactate synthase-1/2/3 large subunit
VDVNRAELGHNRRPTCRSPATRKAVLQQLTARRKGKLEPKKFAAWTGKLRVLDAEKGAEQDKAMSTDETPIHPLRLCKEVRDFLKRDAILVVDGQEILNYGRQAIPTYVARPSPQLRRLRLHGRGACRSAWAPRWPSRHAGGRAARRRLLRHQRDGDRTRRCATRSPCVRHQQQRRLDGGTPWTRPLPKPGRNLGYTRYDKMAMDLGAHGEFVEKPHEIRPALERAAASGKPAVVNVITDSKARANDRPLLGVHDVVMGTTAGSDVRALLDEPNFVHLASLLPTARRSPRPCGSASRAIASWSPPARAR